MWRANHRRNGSVRSVPMIGEASDSSLQADEGPIQTSSDSGTIAASDTAPW